MGMYKIIEGEVVIKEGYIFDAGKHKIGDKLFFDIDQKDNTQNPYREVYQIIDIVRNFHKRYFRNGRDIDSKGLNEHDIEITLKKIKNS